MLAKVEEGEENETNQWLERTGWQGYFKDMDRNDLLDCIERPDPDEEPVEAMIWSAMGGLASFSQESVVSRVGVFIRMEAIRTEKHQTRYSPLKPYQDRKSIVRHSKPWRQVLMFFARTQKPHEWESPPYEFTSEQQRSWEIVWRRA